MKKIFWCLPFLFVACSTPPAISAVDGPSCSGFAEPDTPHHNVAFLVMDGVYNTELTAPYDIFQHTIFRDSVVPMHVFMVAPQCGLVRTFEGLELLPNFSLENPAEIPEVDILVVPSAEKHLSLGAEDQIMVDWVAEVAAGADHVVSHCDGAFVLAKAGLLNGRKATTFPADRMEMARRYPAIEVLDSVLFVHDGKYITSVGGAKSFEASLYLCELMYGRQNAGELAEGLVIDWDLDAVPYLKVDQ